MGVDYYNCSICGEIFNDCGYYGYCAECGSILCEDCREKQVEKYGDCENDEEKAADYGDNAAIKCDLCPGEIIRDGDIISYLLAKSGITREEVEGDMRAKNWRVA